MTTNGEDALRRALTQTDPDRFVEVLGMGGLNELIQRVLDRSYPEDIFLWDRAQFGTLWASEQGGDDIDPGVKWITLLRMALAEVNVGAKP